MPAYLVATLLGSCDYPCHLYKHMFAPKQLLNTFVPGAMVLYNNYIIAIMLLFPTAI